MRPKLTRSLAIMVGALAVFGSARPFAARDFPPDPLAVRMPDDATGADVELIVSIAARLRIPFGFEEAGALSERVSMPFSTGGGSSRPKPLVSVRPTPLDVRGVTLRQALDAVVAKDRRYEWREVGGVAVVRPRAAWRAPEHPLLRPVSAVRPHDAADQALLAALRELSPDFAGGTLFELLNAAARADGRMQWSLRSEASTVLLDHGRAVTATQPVVILGNSTGSRTFPLVPTPPPEPRRP